jgi:hypothetical protein
MDLSLVVPCFNEEENIPDFYECVECGQIEHNFHNTYKEIDRKYMGTHTETTEEEV